MDKSISEEFETFVREQVESGNYGSEEEVVEDGLRLLKDKKERYGEKLEALRRDIALGTAQLENGEGVPFDVDDIIRLAKERKRNRK